HPAKFKNLYQHWMENIKDWCISRQLWWGHRIPAWYLPNGTCIVAETAENAWEKYAAGTIELNEQGQPFTMADLQQDPDCLDTWFSSWLWPFEVFEGYSNPNNEQVNYYYPTASLVTAPEIIFFWVARMIMAGLHFKQQIPFKDEYFTGIVRDEKGRKMSKQLGNSPDLLALIDKYGADAVRFGILISSPAGNDLLFDVKEESTLKQGSFFVNKMWNALKLIDMWRQGQPEAASTPVSAPSWAHQWLQARLGQATAEISQLMAQFRLSEALKAVYTLVWDDFCSWYLEWVKPPYGQQLAAEDIQQVIRFYEQLLLLLHPFMPFVTEEIYHQLSPRTAGDDLTVKTLRAQDADSQQATSIIADGQVLKQIITALRDARNKQQLKPKDTINIDIETNRPQWYQPMLDIIQRQVNAQLQTTPQAQPGGVVVAVEQDKFYLRIEGQQDATQQKESLEKDLAYQQQFLQSVIRKLQNERFVQNAKPEVVAAERKKQTDAEARIAALEEALKNLGA
ncbi:MAG TPA: class I tRNA ligase family protein, partial [Phnomibacter sp.]|nr:class I tRNA ligase family protein [Phnomibacter sp.]